MHLVERLVHTHLQSGLRGRTRLTCQLARRFPSLQAAAVRISGLPPVFVDLRDPANHDLFRGSPYPMSPWEPTTVAVLRQIVRPGDVAYDVGANRGVMTAELSALVGAGGQVHGFEANPDQYASLERTVAACGNATLHRFGLGERPGTLTLHVPDNSEMASIVAPVGGTAGRAVPCRIESLDALVADGLPRPDVMKVDVEGAEALVFRGARTLLDRDDAPVVIFESNLIAAQQLGEPLDAAASFLRALSAPRYEFYVVYGWGLVTRMVPGQLVHDNILAVPAQRRDRWPDAWAADYHFL